MRNIDTFNISIEEFDNLNERHEFSKEYKENKEQMMKEFRKNTYKSSSNKFGKVAAAAAIVLVSAPIAVNAATNGELFNRIWGSTGKENIESHDEVIYDYTGDKTFEVTFPERDYVDMDEEKAQALIGDDFSNLSIVQEIDGTTITVLSAVKDNNAAVVEFTLEKAGGVDILEYGQLSNEARGASISDNATFMFDFGGNPDSIYVDLEKSTDEKLYCYDYIALVSNSNIDMNLYEYPCTLKEYREADDAAFEEITNNIKTSVLDITPDSSLQGKTFANSDDGSIEVSPISMALDMSKGLGFAGEECEDPGSVYNITIAYKDGSEYVVIERPNNMHDAKVEINNTSYICSKGTKITYDFNRLVDTDNIESISVNGVSYK